MRKVIEATLISLDGVVDDPSSWGQKYFDPAWWKSYTQALEACDAAPALDPKFIFHLSRCGSTLCARMLGAADGVTVLSEPGPINDVLMAEIEGLGEDRAARLLLARGRLLRHLDQLFGRKLF